MKKLLLTAALAATTLAAAPQANAGYLPCDDVWNTPDRANLTCDAGALGPMNVEYYRVHILNLAPAAAAAPTAEDVTNAFVDSRRRYYAANRQACRRAEAAIRGRHDFDGTLRAAADYRFGCKRSDIVNGVVFGF